ncbi:MAG: type I glyceraldehyde-3-phosphate dehydrogenase [Deltaproteobacteria bacterium]|nr:type I glyceraldehyde-3-phosphate dehydrogenase [Deltaproteobacteria bacterium]
MIRVGINGFGRIGRQVLKAIMERHPDTLEVAAVNDLGDPHTNAHLFKYDSTYGVFPGAVELTDDGFLVCGKHIRSFNQCEPSQIAWGDEGVDIVVESTGFFRTGAQAAGHLQGGARKVIISAPGKEVDGTFVMGVNHFSYDPAKHNIVSNASCTTNCLAPAAKVIFDRWGIKRGFMNTVHSYTNDQRILDQPHKDLRRARAASLSIIPTSTGAARAVGLVIPELKGKVDGFSLRVPTPTVSIVDFTALLEKPADTAAMNDAFKEAAEKELKGILACTDEPLVSVDFRGNPHSSIVDLEYTSVTEEGIAKILSWYDNEWGYSCRVSDLAAYMASLM